MIRQQYFWLYVLSVYAFFTVMLAVLNFPALLEWCICFPLMLPAYLSFERDRIAQGVALMFLGLPVSAFLIIVLREMFGL